MSNFVEKSYKIFYLAYFCYIKGNDNTLNKEFYITKEIVEMFGINRQALHCWRKKGIIQYKNIGGVATTSIKKEREKDEKIDA